MLVLILRPLASVSISVGLMAAFTTTGLYASDAPASPAGQTQTPHVADNKGKTAKAAKTGTAAKRTIGTNPAMPLWEGPWGPHH